MARHAMVLLVTLGAACASTTESRQDVVKQEASRLKAPEAPLVEYGSFELAPIAMSTEVGLNAGKAKVAMDLGNKLDAALQPLLKEWNAAAPADKRSKALVIQPTVTQLKVVGGGGFRSAWAGDSYVELELAIVEKGSGRVLADLRVKKSAGGMEGAWTSGSSDQALLDYAVEIARQYLVNNHPQ
ncbi:MAG TPA: hypothetical protein VMT17_06160 [Anaeromyxobacteraceae bacterium]|nr:hypothetical protein [Anaeromyxobacteraceae bacterium]